MIVYENGRPKRNDYRKFRIPDGSGTNDYASMREVLRGGFPMVWRRRRNCKPRAVIWRWEVLRVFQIC